MPDKKILRNSRRWVKSFPLRLPFGQVTSILWRSCNTSVTT